MLVTWLLVALVGGALVNYLADVLPETRRFSTPLWWPLSGDKLRKYISRPRVLIVSLFFLLLASALTTFPSSNFPISLYATLLAYFTLVTVIDIEHRVVLHPVSIAGALLLGAIGLTRHSLADTLLGGAAGFGFMLAIYFLGEWLGRLMARARGEAWEETALGFGDVNLAGVIGLLMGWPGVIAALFAGMLAAGLYSALFLLWTMARSQYKAFASIPYAPFLCLGAMGLITVTVFFKP